ncbi:MAG: hypothetical protein HY507_01700 [Candidatus Zambryskibacteria bacterium]|nr:hypothetical protein [Candidatus Zambryskibacteria bacterium]
MPSNKTLTVLIICFGVVISIFLFERNPNRPSSAPQNTNGLTAINPAENVSRRNLDNLDWKKILVDMGPGNQIVTNAILSDESFDQTTLTAQMAKDFFAQYLMLKKGGQPITTNEINKITENTLSLPEYTKATGAVYLASNLHINQNSDTESLKKYRDSLNKSVNDRLEGIGVKEDPMTIFVTAVNKDDEKEMSKLDPIILAGKDIISDLLDVEVPKELVTMHLSLLNTSSNLLLNLEQMRVALTDPVRSFVGANQYPKHMAEFQTALKNLTAYLEQKIK